ncbi:MAG: ribonuclease HII [Candidatus Krumholzibacteriota bacterium]|nr:ribonuclease HII [Candidatus Krumholzibacteriota bacterium]
MSNNPGGSSSFNELSLFDKDIKRGVRGTMAGVDEAGRGALAGPVVAAALVCDFHEDLFDVRDSKLLKENRREELYELIIDRCECFNVGIVKPEVIDRVNILNATLKAMKEAVEGLTISPQFVIVDGRDTPDIEIRAQAIPGGDGKSFVIAAASIVAKVTRDRIMREFGLIYPEYKFLNNKGYGTKEHRTVLKEKGFTKIHRKSFKCSI